MTTTPTVVGGLRGRLIFDSIYMTLSQGLTALGWINGNGPRRNKPVSLVVEQQDVYSEVPINTMALSDENVTSDPWEVGSQLTEDTRYYYIDFFGESDAVSKHIIGDVRDLIMGKMPDIGPLGPEIKVYDYRVKPTPLELFSVDVINVRVDRSHEVGRAWLRHWYSIQFQVVDYYGTSLDGTLPPGPETVVAEVAMHDSSSLVVAGTVSSTTKVGSVSMSAETGMVATAISSITHVQDATPAAVAESPTSTAVFPAATTVGNFLVMVATSNGGGGLTVSGGGVDTWVHSVVGANADGGGHSCDVWTGFVTTPGQSAVTATDLSGSTFYPGCVGTEFSGVNTTTPVADGQSSFSLASVGALTCSTESCTSGQVYYGGGYHAGGVPSPYTPSSGFTTAGFATFTPGGSSYDTSAYQVIPAEGSYTLSFGVAGASFFVAGTVLLNPATAAVASTFTAAASAGLMVAVPGINEVGVGPLVESSSPTFARSTTAGNFLLAYAATNSGSSTFPITASGSGWTHLGQGGSAFAWVSYWYKVNCGANETPPTFGGAGSDFWSQLMEYSGVGSVEQTAGGALPTLSLSNPDSENGELVLAGAYYNTPTTGLTLVVDSFNDSNGAPMTSTTAEQASASGTYAATVRGVAGIAGSYPHSVTFDCEGRVGVGVLASLVPANPTPAATLEVTTVTADLPVAWTAVSNEDYQYARAATSQADAPSPPILVASGGNPPYAWSLVSALPTGMSLSEAGLISGMPTSSGSFGFTAQVTDSQSHTAQVTLTMTVSLFTPIAASSTWNFGDSGYPNLLTSTTDPKWQLPPGNAVYLNNNVWSGGQAGDTQTLNAASLEQWSSVCTFHRTDGAVETYPEVGFFSGSFGWEAAWTKWTSGWDVYLDQQSDTIASAAYDLWFDQSVAPGGAATAINEVMCHFYCVKRYENFDFYAKNIPFGGFTDFKGNFIPPYTASLDYPGGPTGGSTYSAWVIVDSEENLPLRQTKGAIDWYGMLKWMVDNGLLATGSHMTGFFLGFEVCSTNGQPRVFAYNDSWVYVGA